MDACISAVASAMTLTLQRILFFPNGAVARCKKPSVELSGRKRAHHTHLPYPLPKHETHWHTAVFEQPTAVRNVAKELSNQLLAKDGVRNVSDEVQVWVY